MDASWAAAFGAEPQTAAKRWLIHTTKSLIIIRDHPGFAGQRTSEIQFLGIACRTGAAREGKDTADGFKQKLVSLCATGKPLDCLAILGILTYNQDLFLLVATEAVPIVLRPQGYNQLQQEPGHFP
ncbi:INP53 [Symbiodinium natans]|uniref:INP53 protein n=1 Tax=Symbiodinium natans TaxID=878477 RepID=A0A812JI89_9DINO|nr:INP53 [Symbiodinium natans]